PERVVVVLSARIPRGLARVRPARADGHRLAELLGGREPIAVTAALVLELQVARNVAAQALPDGAHGRAEIGDVLGPELVRVLRTDIGGVGAQRDRRHALRSSAS